jgi:hypothetical protein
MPPIILLALLAGVPLVLLTVLRVKPLYIFTSVITGYLWATFLGEPAELMLQSLVHVAHPGSVARLVLLAIPIVLTLLLMRKSLPASSLPFQFFLLVANSLLIATFVLNLLPPGTRDSLYATNPGNILRQANDVLIAGIAGLHVLVMWIMRPRHHEGAHGHGHHKKKH